MSFHRLIGLGIILVTVAIICGCSGDLTGGWSSGPPGAPNNVEIATIGNEILLKWPCVKGATHYTLFWGKESRRYQGLKDTPACSIIVEGLELGSIYRFAVTSWNDNGESNFSDELTFIYETDPEQSAKYIKKGNELMKQGKYELAHVYFSTAIRLNPENPKAYARRATLLKKLDSINLAEEDLKRANDLRDAKE